MKHACICTVILSVHGRSKFLGSGGSRTLVDMLTRRLPRPGGLTGCRCIHMRPVKAAGAKSRGKREAVAGKSKSEGRQTSAQERRPQTAKGKRSEPSPTTLHVPIHHGAKSAGRGTRQILQYDLTTQKSNVLQARTHIVPALEQFFDDSDIMSAAFDTEADVYPTIIPQSPLVQHYHDLRGVRTEYNDIYYQLNLASASQQLYACDYFRCYFYPPWHFRALGRKTRPATGFTFADGGYEFNGVPLSEGPERPTLFYRSRNPFKSGWYRSQIKKQARRVFLAQFQKHGGPDGLYWFWMRKACDNDDVLSLHMEDVLIRAAHNAQTNAFKWVDKANKLIDIGRVDALFRSHSIKPFRWQSQRDWVDNGGDSCKLFRM